VADERCETFDPTCWRCVINHDRDESAPLLDEIKRLRRLGDTLAHYVRAGKSKEMYSAVHAWEEARRG
jgi:hypothetical protein